jgi:integrase
MSELTLAEWKERQWPVVTGTITAGTVRAYSSAWTRRLAPILGHVPLTEIDAFSVEEAWAVWTGAWSTKKDAVSLLSRLMKRALKAKLIAENPVPQIEVGRDQSPDPVARALEPAELTELFLRVPPGEYRRAIYALAYAGLRFGECAGLIVRDVNLAEGVMHIRRSASLDAHGRLDAVARRPKSRSVRTVPILDQFAPVLAEAIRGKDDLDLVFPGPRGGTLTSKNLSRAIKWEDWREDIRRYPDGVAPLRFHDLRHTACTLFLRASVPVHEVQLIMGHSSIAVTELYAHSNAERIRGAGAKLSAYLELEDQLAKRAA